MTLRNEKCSANGNDRLLEFERGVPQSSAGTPGLGGELQLQSWLLDAEGNWSAFDLGGGLQSGIPNEMNEYSQFASINQEHDDNGNLLADGMHRYKYDAFNRLRVVEQYANPGVVEATYEYDALGRRIRRQVNNNWGLGIPPKKGNSPFAPQNPAEDDLLYFYDGLDVLQETNSLATITKREFVEDIYQSGHIQIKVLENEAVPANTGTFYYMTNSQGWVTALTDSTGNVIERYHYTPYGTVSFHNPDNTGKSSTRSDFSNPYLYGGYRYDPEPASTTAMHGTTTQNKEDSSRVIHLAQSTA